MARIFIVLPTLGRRLELLAETLASIAEQDEPADVVMVAPAEAGEARALALSHGALVASDPGGGLSAAVNAGLARAEAEHEFWNWIGDDDLLAPGALRAASGALDAAPDAVVAFGYCDYIDAEGHRLFTSRAGRLAPWIMTWGPDLVPQPGALVRLAAVREVGGLDTSLTCAMDLDLFLRLRRVGRFVSTGRTLAAFRWHPASTTVANRDRNIEESETVKRRYLAPPWRQAAGLWEAPVRIATRAAARRVDAMAGRVAGRRVEVGDRAGRER